MLLLALRIGGDLDLLRGGRRAREADLAGDGCRSAGRGAAGGRGPRRGAAVVVAGASAALPPPPQATRRGARRAENGERASAWTSRELLVKGLCGQCVTHGAGPSAAPRLQGDRRCRARSRRPMVDPVLRPAIGRRAHLARRLEVALALPGAGVEADEEGLAGPAPKQATRTPSPKRRGRTAAARAGRRARPGGRCRGEGVEDVLVVGEEHQALEDGGGCWTSAPSFHVQRSSPFSRSRERKRRSVVPSSTRPSSSTTGAAASALRGRVAPQQPPVARSRQRDAGRRPRRATTRGRRSARARVPRARPAPTTAAGPSPLPAPPGPRRPRRSASPYDRAATRPRRRTPPSSGRSRSPGPWPRPCRPLRAGPARAREGDAPGRPTATGRPGEAVEGAAPAALACGHEDAAAVAGQRALDGRRRRDRPGRGDREDARGRGRGAREAQARRGESTRRGPARLQAGGLPHGRCADAI